MDQFLAEYYGTEQGVADGVADDDIEKMAQLTLLTKEAAAEGVDLTEFSDDELVAMADDLYGGGVESAEVDLEKEAAEKFAEADYLGRVMAHAHHQEAVAIQKEAGIKETAGSAVSKLRSLAGRARQSAREGAEALGERTVYRKGSKAEGRMMTRAQQADPGFDLGITADRRLGRTGSVFTSTPKHQLAMAQAKRRAGSAVGGGAALGAAGAGGGIYAGTREKKSADSAFEQLVVDRANEHLGAAGLLDKTAGEEDFETIVDRAALELLEANGHTVEWY